MAPHVPSPPPMPFHRVRSSNPSSSGAVCYFSCPHPAFVFAYGRTSAALTPPLTDPDGGGGPFYILSPVSRHFLSIFSRVLSVPTLVGKSIPWPLLNDSYMELKQWATTEIRCFLILEFKETTKVKTDKGNINTG